MTDVGKHVGVAIAGVASAFTVLAVWETAMSKKIPQEDMAAYVEGKKVIPDGICVALLSGNATAAAIGAFTVCKLAPSDQLRHAIAFGSMMTVLQAANFTHAKVPKWYIPAGLLAFLPPSLIVATALGHDKL